MSNPEKAMFALSASESSGAAFVASPRTEKAEVKSKRINALDFTKGVLVLFMVAYHCLNYSSEWHRGFRLMSFLPPSFIIITGFIISNVYFSRPNAQFSTLAGRLVVRGLKLVVIFTAVNMLAMLFNHKKFEGQPLDAGTFFSHAFEIYVFGDRRFAAFEVLLPIGYILLFGPVCFLIQRWQPMALVFLTAFALAGCVFLEYHGSAPYNAILFSAGLIGISLGRIPLANLNHLARWWPICAVIYVLQSAFAMLWLSPLMMQMVAACLMLAAIYGVGVRLGSSGTLQTFMETLGKYSLLSYISQIAFLQVLSHIFHLNRPDLFSLKFLILPVGTLALMIACVLLTDVLRRKQKMFDSAYRAVFA